MAKTISKRNHDGHDDTSSATIAGVVIVVNVAVENGYGQGANCGSVLTAGGFGRAFTHA